MLRVLRTKNFNDVQAMLRSRLFSRGAYHWPNSGCKAFIPMPRFHTSALLPVLSNDMRWRMCLQSGRRAASRRVHWIETVQEPRRVPCLTIEEVAPNQ